ncbi:immunoglobulin superfamily member 8 isoform X1 [Bufo gargarizans]|uniref:immunoglobulin superfamily member 8 isoform X1 n=1 Tax=Bufo gargarizans TaxID=30331 RepID=UPI001CF3DB1D|nr:immunoglobulin superfamily member 8 isoform X1 [Bufo gargarizans]
MGWACVTRGEEPLLSRARWTLRMRRSMQSALLLLIVCTAGWCAGREVKVPGGPLYRVEGVAVSIPCNVSGYEGPAVQNFEWFVYRPGAPDISIAIVSTKDPNFSYAVFRPRVASGDVSIHRLGADSVELRIQRLRKEDEGVYECYTPTTDARYLGSYSAKIAMTVLPDTLQVSSKGMNKGRVSSPLQLHLVEGRELHLSCWALATTSQHTHLSVSFGVSAPGAPVGRDTLQDIISVRWDFSVEPARYRERYLNEEIRVEKTANSTYKMVIARLRPQDAGTYHCTAAQWIQDPDGGWQKISEKRSVLAQVSVQTIDSQLQVSSRPRELHVQSGDTLEMFCNVSMLTPPPLDLVFSVQWWVTSTTDSPGHLVASVSAEGAVQLGEQYVGQDVGARHLSLEKISPSPGTFRLRIYSAQPGDTGAYYCQVTASVTYPGARQEEVSTKTSPSLTVLMRPQDIVVKAFVVLDSTSIYRGDTAVLLCNISVDAPTPSLHVAVGWWVELIGKEPHERTGRLVASVTRQGVSEVGARVSGELSTDKVGAECHRLRLYNVQAEDEGSYHCVVTAWLQYPDHSWYNAASTKSNIIRLYPYAPARDLLLIPLIGGFASALVVGITILSTVTCCYIRHLRIRKR